MSDLDNVLEKIKEDFKKIAVLQRNAELAVANTKTEHQQWEARLNAAKSEHGKLMGQLAAAKTANDKAAEEAASRIELSRKQTEELVKIRSVVDKKHQEALDKEKATAKLKSAMAEREADLVQREGIVSAAQESMDKKLARLRADIL